MLDLYFLIVFAMAGIGSIQQTPIAAFPTAQACATERATVLSDPSFSTDSAKEARVVVLCVRAVDPYASTTREAS